MVTQDEMITTAISFGLMTLLEKFTTKELAECILRNKIETETYRTIVFNEILRRKKELWKEVAVASVFGFLMNAESVFLEACINSEYEEKIMNFGFKQFGELLKKPPTA